MPDNASTITDNAEAATPAALTDREIMHRYAPGWEEVFFLTFSLVGVIWSSLLVISSTPDSDLWPPFLLIVICTCLGVTTTIGVIADFMQCHHMLYRKSN